MLSRWNTKSGNESQRDVCIEGTPPFGRRLAHVETAAHASLGLSKPHSHSLFEWFHEKKTSRAKGSCVVTPDPCVLQLVSFLLLQRGQAQIFLVVLRSATVLCATLWQHLIFLDLYSIISNLFSSCHWWQLPILHRSRNVPRRRGLCTVLVGLVTGVPRFIARKPSAEDDTLVVCPPKIVFPVAMWRPPSCALLLLCQKSGEFPWQVWIALTAFLIKARAVMNSRHRKRIRHKVHGAGLEEISVCLQCQLYCQHDSSFWIALLA